VGEGVPNPTWPNDAPTVSMDCSSVSEETGVFGYPLSTSLHPLVLPSLTE